MVWVPFSVPENGQLPETPPAFPSRLPESVPEVAVEFPVNINTTTAKELEALAGIGTELARRIIEYRTVNGLFTDPEDIQKVDGIGSGKFEAIKDLIAVDAFPPESDP